MALWILLAGAGCAAADWVEIPRHPVRSREAGGFELGACEVTVTEFTAFLNASDTTDYPETRQIEPRRKGRYAAKAGTARQAVAEVTLSDAQAYSRWKSQKEGRTIRLPTEAEWEIAARGGVAGAPFPWGWGGEPSKMARFDADGPARQGGRFPSNGFGLNDMAGNLYEWCAPAAGLPMGRGIARGGSWAEREPAVLTVDHRQEFAETYRGRDVGFRVLREIDKDK